MSKGHDVEKGETRNWIGCGCFSLQAHKKSPFLRDKIHYMFYVPVGVYVCINSIIEGKKNKGLWFSTWITQEFSLAVRNQIPGPSFARRQLEQLSSLLMNQNREIGDHTCGELDTKKEESELVINLRGVSLRHRQSFSFL